MKKRMDINKIKIENIARIASIFESDQRKSILEILLNSLHPLTIAEVQKKCNIPNYKNTFNNLKKLEDAGLVKIERYKKHIEGIKISTSSEMILKAIVLPLKKDIQSIEDLFRSYVVEDVLAPLQKGTKKASSTIKKNLEKLDKIKKA